MGCLLCQGERSIITVLKPFICKWWVDFFCLSFSSFAFAVSFPNYVVTYAHKIQTELLS